MMGKPKIRFKGYNEDWEQRKLGEIATYRNGKAHEANQLDVGTYELVNLNSISIDGGLKPSGKFIEDGGDTLQRNDLVMVLSDVGHGDLLGRVAIIPENNRYVLNQRVALLRINDDTNTYFLFSIINRYQDYFKKLGAGSSQLNISRGIVENFEVTYPNVAEQRMIADYFHSLDHVITLHQHKCDEMKKMKKCMLQKMFPQNGKKVPEIRFEGFTNDWEQRKLNEIADRVSEKNKNNEFSEPFTNSAEQGIISQRDYFDREIVNNENLNGYYIVRNDDFIYNPRISVTAPVGPINRNRLGRNGVMSPLYTVFRTHDINNLYLEFYFKTTKWHRFMKLNGDSGARFDRFTISSTQFMEMPIPYPMLDEQIKIGEYFDTLDHLITLHQHKCDELQNLKKYMLQNMFV